MNMSNDDTLDLLKDFLPDIEAELRNQIQPDIEEEYNVRLEQEMRKIQQQAQQEYSEAMATLQQQFQQLKGEKMHELQLELVHLQQLHQERQRLRLAQAQERFLLEHFDDRIMAHPSLEQLEDNLESEIAEVLFARYSAIRDKRIKELRVRLESREQKDRLQADRAIKADIYAKSGLEELKEDLHKFKISIAAQKSQYNIRMSKIVAQVKALQKKCMEIEYDNSDMLIEQMEAEIEELQRQMTQQQQQQQSEPSSFADDSSIIQQKERTIDFGENFSKNKQFNINLNQHCKLNSCLGDAQYINQDLNFDSEDSLDESNSRDCRTLPPPPPASRQQLLQQLIQQPIQSQPKRQEITLQMPHKPLLNFNIGQMLRQQWEEDSFDRYLSQRDKENNSHLPNQESNFQTLYSQHLKRLNNSSKVPKTRVSITTDRTKGNPYFGSQ